MKKNRKSLVVILLVLILLTGCTKTLTTQDKKAVRNPETGQSLTENILCRPKDKDTIKIYEDNKVNIENLPECKNFKVNSGGYEGLWTSIFVKPLAWIIIQIGNIVKNYGLSLVIVSLLIRLIAFPVTRKTAMQSEMLKNAKPELDKLEKKYKDKTDQESLMKKNQEMMLIYKKYNVNLKKPAGVREMSTTKITVNMVVDNIVTKEIPDVRINSINLASGLKVQALSKEDSSVTVIISGSESVIKDIDSSKINAYIDLADLSVGEHEVEIKVTGNDNKITYTSKTKKVKVRISAE